MIDKKGQLKKILVMVFLVLLVAIGIIAAQNIVNNSNTQTNNINNTENINAFSSNENTELSNELNNSITNTETNNITNLCTGMFCNVSTIICPDSFITTCENFCVSETGICTSCVPGCEGHETEANETIGNETTETNETEGTGNETEEPEITPPGTGDVIETGTPQLEIQLSYLSKITRGEIIEIKATITDSGAKAKKVIANWILPQDFEIISGNLTENCGNLNSGESCTSAIIIQTSYSTSLGKNQIKIAVSYEK